MHWAYQESIGVNGSDIMKRMPISFEEYMHIALMVLGTCLLPARILGVGSERMRAAATP